MPIDTTLKFPPKRVAQTKDGKVVIETEFRCHEAYCTSRCGFEIDIINASSKEGADAYSKCVQHILQTGHGIEYVYTAKKFLRLESSEQHQ